MKGSGMAGTTQGANSLPDPQSQPVERIVAHAELMAALHFRHGTMPDYEAILRSGYERLIRPGDTVVDAGAHSGGHTAIFCELVGADGAVIAFEPLPDIFLKLRSNITSQNACLVNAALSDQSGRTSFVHARGTPWESGLRQRILTDPQHADPVTIEVEAMRLDDWIEDMTALRYIKIDVEGGEMAVLQGAERTLGRFRPIISVEYGFQGYSVYGHEKRTLWDFAAAHDYILGDLFGAPCYSVDTWNLVCGRSYWDYYIVPRERTEEWQAAVSGSTPQ
jgi:FkbM family methyltransferase